MKLNFLHAGTNSRKLKDDWNFLGWVRPKNTCSHSGDGTLKLTVSDEWADGWTYFLHVLTDSQKLKTDQKLFWWTCSKMGVASLITRSRDHLKNEQMDETDFLHTGTNSGKLKIDSMIFRWVWYFTSLNPKIGCIWRMNLRIELIFWMLI